MTNAFGLVMVLSWSRMLQLRLYRALLRCHRFIMGHLHAAILHGSAALPPIHYSFFFQSFKCSVTGADCFLGLAHAVTVVFKKRKRKRGCMCPFDSFIKMDWMTFSLFFIHCSKIFNFVFLDSSSSWWRGRWYPWIRHGSLSDRYYELTWLSWVIWTSKEWKGFFRDSAP
jgi:hypothetical protein